MTMSAMLMIKNYLTSYLHKNCDEAIFYEARRYVNGLYEGITFHEKQIEELEKKNKELVEKVEELEKQLVYKTDEFDEYKKQVKELKKKNYYKKYCNMVKKLENKLLTKIF